MNMTTIKATLRKDQAELFDTIIKVQSSDELKKKYTTYENKQIGLNAEGFDRLKQVLKSTGDQKQAAESVGISINQLHRFARCTCYKYYDELSKIIELPSISEEYQIYEAKHAIHVQTIYQNHLPDQKKAKAAVIQYLRDVNYRSRRPSKKNKRRSDGALWALARDYLLYKDLKKSLLVTKIAENDDLEPSPLEMKIIILTSKINAMFEVSNTLIHQIDTSNDRTRAGMIARTINSMLHEALTIAEGSNND